MEIKKQDSPNLSNLQLREILYHSIRSTQSYIDHTDPAPKIKHSMTSIETRLLYSYPEIVSGIFGRG